MKLLFLCKRFPQGRDLLLRPYGRFYHLPRLLAAHGHQVHVCLLSYRRLTPVRTVFDGVHWSSDDLWPNGLARYLARQDESAKALQPDWVIGLSDTYFGIMAQRLAGRYGARSVIDAYDNFEAYMPWALPLHWWWRRAVANADLVTAAGPHLADRLRSQGARRCEVLPMAADPAFAEMDRAQCRARLGLPVDRRLIGQIGAFDQRRGHAVVLEALDQVMRSHPDVSLVLSGSASTAFNTPPRTYGLGYLSDEQLPALVNSLDVAVVSLADNSFCRYSYPAKLAEAMACNVPVVASATGPSRWMLGDDDRFLAPVGDAPAMAEGILRNLRVGRARYPTRPSWSEVADRMQVLLAGGKPEERA